MNNNYQKLFFIGAIWNLLIAVSLIGAQILRPDILLLFNTRPLQDELYFYISLSLVFAYGIGYYWASKDFKSNKGVVLMGIIGKQMVFIIEIVAFFKGHITPLFLMSGIGDLIFSILFLKAYLDLTKK